MPRRWSTSTRPWVYRYLAIRDGEHCQICLKQPNPAIPATQNARPATQNALEIDHRDGNPRNNDPENLRLLCKSCNVAESNRKRSPSDRVRAQEERRRAEGQSATRIAKASVDYSTGDAAMRANQFFENKFRDWLLGTIARIGHLEKEDAINSGAEITGSSITTAARYLSKLTSSAGPLREITDLTGRAVIALKPELIT